MKILNYTPHAVTVFDDDGNVLSVYQSAGVIRAEQKSTIIAHINDIPVKRITYGAVEDLPASCEPDTYFIVSAITAQAARATNHPLADRLLVVADPVRNADGQIIGCCAFSQI